MGYRSSGALYLSTKLQFLLPLELKEDLVKDWYRQDENVWEFNDWKWYSSYPEIKRWETYFKSLKDNESISEDEYDFMRIGEEAGDVETLTGSQFYCNTNWERY